MPILIRCLHKDQSREMLEHWFTYNFHAIADGQIHYSKNCLNITLAQLMATLCNPSNQK